MREIKLGQSFVAIVDEEDFEELSKHRWRAERSQWGHWYAVRRTKDENGKHKKIWMHR